MDRRIAWIIRSACSVSSDMPVLLQIRFFPFASPETGRAT